MVPENHVIEAVVLKRCSHHEGQGTHCRGWIPLSSAGQFIVKRRTLTTVLLFVLVFGAPGAFAQPLKIAASIYPIGDMVKQVGGDRVDVQVLLPPGASPHVFEPTVKTAKELSRARVFFEVGAGLDFWADRLVRASKQKIMVVALSDGMKLLREEGEHADEHETGNPHVWLDPVLAVEMVRKIEGVLEQADPKGASVYRGRSSEYIMKLHGLDEEIKVAVSAFRIRGFVSFHPAWDYFALR